MPTCSSCHSLFVRPQTMQNLLNLKKQCDQCALYSQIDPDVNVLPLAFNLLELYSFNYPSHPALTKKLYKLMIDTNKLILFLETEWMKNPTLFSHLSELVKPLKLYHDTHLSLDAIERLVNQE